MKEYNIFIRMIIALLGMAAVSIGINTMLGTGLGVSPLDTVCAQFSEFLSINLGNATFLFDSIFFIMLIIYAFGIDKKVEVKGSEVLVSLLSIFILTRIINIFGFLQLINNFIYIAFFIGFIFYALGFKLMYDSNLIIAPADKIVVVICRGHNIKEGTGKFVFDVILVIISVFFSLLLVLTIHLTIISILLALITGPMINLYTVIFQKLGI